MPDDESSIWFTRWNIASLQTVALYQLTPSGHFHVYPASAGDYVYFSDLKNGDIFRINRTNFFQDYTSFETAQELGTLYLDSGQRPRRPSRLHEHLQQFSATAFISQNERHLTFPMPRI